MSGSLDLISVRCGDVVRERDGRHLAVVVAVFNWTVRVRWEDTGWLSDLPAEALEAVERARGYVPRMAPLSRPSTIVESPKRRLERELAGRWS